MYLAKDPKEYDKALKELLEMKEKNPECDVCNKKTKGPLIKMDDGMREDGVLPMFRCTKCVCKCGPDGTRHDCPFSYDNAFHRQKEEVLRKIQIPVTPRWLKWLLKGN